MPDQSGDPPVHELLAALGAAEQAPPDSLRERVLSRIAPLPFTFVRAHEGLWLGTNEGVTIKALFLDSGDRWSTLLVRLAPGTELPQAWWGGARHLLVVAGRLEGNGRVLLPGAMVDESALDATPWRAVEPSELLVQERAKGDGLDASINLGDVTWRTISPGIRVAIRPASAVTMVEASPGAILPEHAHDGIEELFVLSGSCVVERETMAVGDYHRAAAGSAHQPAVAGTEGCVLFTSLRRD